MAREEVTFEMRIKVRYVLHGDNADTVRLNLSREMDRAIQDGMLTGATDAEVDEYSAEVQDFECEHNWVRGVSCYTCDKCLSQKPLEDEENSN